MTRRMLGAAVFLMAAALSACTLGLAAWGWGAGVASWATPPGRRPACSWS